MAGCIFFLTEAGRLAAQTAGPDPGFRWMRLKISDVNVGLQVENEMETRRTKSSPDEISVDRLYVAPTLGLDMVGSVYHPNLLQYTFGTETGFGWQELDTRGPAAAAFTGTRQEQGLLQQYNGQFTFLPQKPYTTTLFVNKASSFREVDFFNRITVDSQGYGGYAGYSRGPVPFTISAVHQEEVERGLQRNLSTKEDTLSLNARHERSPGGTTTLSYTLNQFNRQQPSVPTDTGLNHTVSLFDNSVLGKNDRLGFSTSLFYNRLNRLVLPSSSFSAQESVVLKHTKTLESQYTYSFDTRSSGAVDTGNQRGRALLRHHLYDSLVSSVDFEAQNFESQSSETSLASKGYGFGWSENYTKRLGSWGRLGLGYSWRGSQEDRESTGRFQQILNEQHALSDRVITFLAQPLVIRSSIRVTDPSGTTIYQELLDYLIIEQGSLTEIKRVPGTTRILDGGAVAVDYRVVASPTTSFSTFANQAQIRLDLFNRLLGVYGRVNLVDHDGGETVILQEIADKVAGVDVTWRWLHAGSEYEIFDSNLAPFNSLRVFETLTFEPAGSATLNFDFGQSHQLFRDTGVSQMSYHFIGRFKWRITYGLSYELEGGVRIIEGRGLDQQLTTIRTGLDFSYGKLTASLGYEFQDEVYIGELRQRQFMFLRVKRSF